MTSLNRFVIKHRVTFGSNMNMKHVKILILFIEIKNNIWIVHERPI